MKVCGKVVAVLLALLTVSTGNNTGDDTDVPVNRQLEVLERHYRDVKKHPTSPGPCTSPYTVNLTEYWRKDNFGSKVRPVNGDYNCDRTLQGNSLWFRFTEGAGTQLRNTCPLAYSCGSHGGFWSDAPMPSHVGEKRIVPIYGSWAGICQWYTWPVTNALTVQRCSSRKGDFVYKVYGTSSCNWSFCSME